MTINISGNTKETKSTSINLIILTFEFSQIFSGFYVIDLTKFMLLVTFYSL